MSLVETPKKNTGQEAALVAFLERMERQRASLLAVHIHLSRLSARNQRSQYIQAAFTTFDDAVSQQDGQTFLLRNNDIIFVGLATQAQMIEDAVIRLRFLFSEDSLVLFSDVLEDSSFCTWHVLERDYDKFLDTCRRLHSLTRTRLPTDLSSSGPPRIPLDAKSLSTLEDLLIGANLSNIIRNQPICSIGDGAEVSPLFHEIYVSISALEETLMPLVQIAGNPWLFQYVTQLLDKRMLAHLSHEWAEGRRISINMNVSTLLSPEFQKFDQMISTSARGRLVIEVQKVDIFADMGAFLFAREFVRDRGYRLCLDGMTHLTLPFIDREKLGLDMVKLFWSPDLATSTNPRQVEELRASLAAFGAARVILARCDSESAVKTGLSLGINLFQGRYVNGLMQQHSRVTALKRARG